MTGYLYSCVYSNKVKPVPWLLCKPVFSIIIYGTTYIVVLMFDQFRWVDWF